MKGRYIDIYSTVRIDQVLQRVIRIGGNIYLYMYIEREREEANKDRHMRLRSIILKMGMAEYGN